MKKQYRPRIQLEEPKAHYRDFVIESGARALCEDNNCDPDFVPEGSGVPNWKHYVPQSTIVVDAIFDIDGDNK